MFQFQSDNKFLHLNFAGHNNNFKFAFKVLKN